MFRDLPETLERAYQQSMSRQKPDPYPEAKRDAVALGLFLRARVSDIRRAVEYDDLRLLTDGDGGVCPTCAGFTWGRPTLPEDVEGRDRHDYSRRMCSECGTVRDNPKGAR